MKKSRFKVEQIVYLLKQVGAWVPIKEICRRYGISENTFYKWRNKSPRAYAWGINLFKQLHRLPHILLPCVHISIRGNEDMGIRFHLWSYARSIRGRINTPIWV